MAMLGPFSKRTYVVPFGRYVGATEVEPPADEVLVGREGQRAFLIDLLISTGRRGAYLVTGRRGTGKTSFVKHCIAEYEASVFSRFLRANVGRGFWDRAFVVLFWSALLLGALMVSEILQLLTSARTGDPLAWIAFAPIGILFLYPCVYAKVVFETIFRSLRVQDTHRETAVQSILATLLVLFLMAVAWFTRGLANPPTVSAVIPVLCGCYFFAQATSFENTQRYRPFLWQLILHVFLILYLLLVWTVARSPIKLGYPIASVVRAHVGLGLLLLGIGYALRGWHQKGNSRLENLKGSVLREVIADAIKSGAGWYLWAGLAVSTSGLFTWTWQAAPGSNKHPILDSTSDRLLILFTLLLVTAFFLRRLLHRQAPSSADPKFRPRPAWLLTIKAAVSIIISLQLVYPILANIPLRRIYPPLTSLSSSVCHEGRSALCESAGFDVTDEKISSPKPLFLNRDQELLWLLALLILVVMFHLLEYEWIIRPYLRSREDSAFDPSGDAAWEDATHPLVQAPSQSARQRWMHRRLAELTIPWVVYKNWLPVLPVSVNLGFDRLDHRQVIQAMLVGLQERYYRTFLAWNSGFANLGRFLGVLVLLMLVTLAGGPQLDVLRGDFQSEKWFRLLNADLLPQLRGSGETFIFHLLPHNQENSEEAAMAAWRSLRKSQLSLSAIYLIHNDPYRGTPVTEIHFRVYHIILFLGFLLLARWLLFKVPLLPYKENLRRIDNLLDSLSARTRTMSGHNLWGPARWVYSFLVDDRVQEMERDPVDPRTVELAFLQILEDAQKGGFRFPGAAKLHLTMPAPEITFIFDELDKLGTRVDPDLARESSAQEQETEVLHQERERSVKLRTLLSDLKNILASAPARFIFVGGRDLHDEWLADQTSRQPLLISIFHTEVYLPSLLTDHGKHSLPQDRRLHRRAGEYLLFQHRRAQLLHYRSARKRWRPSFGLALESLVYERFAPSEASSIKDHTIVEQVALEIKVIDSKTGDQRDIEGSALLRDFVLFLTHRSMGNPKKQKDLFASFIRPAGREIEETERRWEASPCRHVLRFSDTEIFRIQLVVNLYRHLALLFEARMVRRDDKFAISIFFLTDFLFKFHRRAFSWSNLERVDDLAHIHRLPDLRDIQEEIVNHFSERFLHRVLNGLYAFRFRSDIAAEVEYLSRQSAAEMAALNFTLDESQSLKAEYEAALKGKEEDNPDLVAALGELYEFDQDFERARYYYHRAIDLLDREIKSLTAQVDTQTGEFHPGAPIRDILAGEHLGPDNARRFLSWGTARLRFMLQIGMTFEHSRDLERAQAEYRNARTLARSLVTAYVGNREQSGSRQGSHRLHTLKHLNILFQPLFAEAWLSEKFMGSIDTSISLVERSLWEVRSALPFVRRLAIPKMKDATQTRHSNFALTLSQLHNKAGDLYFFKGRQPVRAAEIREMIKNSLAASPQNASRPSEARPDQSTDGYLLRAHYHYAVGLHELRRYIRYRVESSNIRLRISEEPAETLQAKELPDFLFRAVGGGVNDMAEATLARVSLFSLFENLGSGAAQASGYIEDLGGLLELFEKWLGEEKPEDPEKLEKLENWFGCWQPSGVRLISFTGRSLPAVRLAMSLKLCLVGAYYFERGGYPEDAGRELLQVCETVTRYLWWGRSVQAMSSYAAQANDGSNELFGTITTKLTEWAMPVTDVFLNSPTQEYWLKLIEMAIYALKKADTLFRESRYARESMNEREIYVVGTAVPAEALTLLCSLGLAAQDLFTKPLAGVGSRKDAEAPKDDLNLSSRHVSQWKIAVEACKFLAIWWEVFRKGNRSPAPENAGVQQAGGTADGNATEHGEVLAPGDGSVGTGTAKLEIPGTGAKEEQPESRLANQIKELTDLLKEWIGDTEDADTDFQRVLVKALERHRYPMLNRLNGMKVLIDYLVLKEMQGGACDSLDSLEQARVLTEELLDLNAQYDAPLHFTPMHTGTTCAMLWLQWISQKTADDERRPIERVFREAQRDLGNSEEMYTMRRAYYEAINDLYYLYDDFNDRQIHFNHAIQMAGAELTSLLKALVDLRDYVDPPF